MDHLQELNSIFKAKTGVAFENYSLLQQALTHDSMGEAGLAFERMEFLGDACLEMVIAANLVESTTFPEGKMSQFRSNLTRKESLASILKSWNIEAFFQVGRGMKKAKLPDSVYADFLESLFGALYLDQGFETVNSCITHIFKPIIEEQKDNPNLFSNAKSKLQELAMAQKADLPVYQIKSRSGKDHNPIYTIEVEVLEQTFCASGPSIKIAEVRAAESALAQLKKYSR